MAALDTIAAVATPIGEGAIALVRISGPESLAIASRIFVRGKKQVGELIPNHTHFGRIVDQGELIDEVLLTFFRAPKSYTTEDTIEISCHGGKHVATRILTATLHNGARLANPGEFTKRAFLNGRMDLTQAEAVAELIATNSEMARRAAVKQLGGSLRSVIEPLRTTLISCLAEIEASIDFSEEDISTETSKQIKKRLNSIAISLEDARFAHQISNRVRNGFRAPIIGLPNTGKSSLLNALLSRERAIVSSIPGTTRDTIEELITIEGIPIKLIDTAGIRESGEQVEMQGVERAMQACDEADMILFVTEANRSLTAAEQEMLSHYPTDRVILVMNKSDLVPDATLPIADVVHCRVSATTGKGIGELTRRLLAKAASGLNSTREVEFLTNSRHEDGIRRARTFLTSAITSIEQEMPIEVTASELRLACNALGEVIGVVSTEELLDEVFSTFCIGK